MFRFLEELRDGVQSIMCSIRNALTVRQPCHPGKLVMAQKGNCSTGIYAQDVTEFVDSTNLQKSKRAKGVFLRD